MDFFLKVLDFFSAMPNIWQKSYAFDKDFKNPFLSISIHIS